VARVTLRFGGKDPDAYRDAADAVTDAAAEFVLEWEFPEGLGLSAGATGLRAFVLDARESARADLKAMDARVLPLALIVLAFVVGNARLLLVAVWNVAATVGLTMIVMNVVAGYLAVSEFAPSVMMSLTVAMGVDYSLFLLCRVTEEVNDASDQENKEAADDPDGEDGSESIPVKTYHDEIAVMLDSAGHTIIASGSTLCGCFLGLAMLPMDIVRSVGVGCAVAVCSALACNLILTPALLHGAGGFFFKKSGRVWAYICCIEEGSTGRMGGRGAALKMRKMRERMEKEMMNDGMTLWPEDLSERKDEDGDDDPFTDLSEPLLSDGTTPAPTAAAESAVGARSDDDTVFDDESNSFWYRLGRILLHRVYGPLILVPILAVAYPVGKMIPGMGQSISFDLLLPFDSPPLATFHAIGETFGPGTLSPYKIVFDGRIKGDTSVESAESFEVMHAVIEALTGKDFPATPTLKSFTGIACAGGKLINLPTFILARVACENPIHKCQDEGFREIDAIFKATTVPSVTYVTAVLDVDPYSKPGTEWLEAARAKIAEMDSAGNLTGLDVHLQGGSSVEFDAVGEVYARLPLVIGITMVVVFALMGGFFGSLVVPLRSVLSISYTLLLVFGLATWTYQDGLLDWTGLRFLHSSGEVSWLPPVMTFSIIVGLGLDYDVFLISRVLEYRETGFTDNASVLKGLYKTGGIITAAGIIMAVAFGGLMTSRLIILNQAAFLLIVAVLLDTFVVRTLVVPILMGLTAPYSWWPRLLPETFPSPEEHPSDELYQPID